MEVLTILQPWIPLLTAVVSALVGYLLGHRKQRLETGLLHLQQVEKTLELWKMVTDELRKEYEKLQQEHRNSLEKLRLLGDKVNTLEHQLSSMKIENKKLTNLIEKLKKDYHATISDKSATVKPA